MQKTFSGRSLVASSFLVMSFMALPAFAASKSAASAAASMPDTFILADASTATVPVTPAPASTKSPIAPTSPAAPAAPVAKAVDHPTAESVTVGDLTVNHPSLTYKKDHIDVFLSIKNNGKFDETLIGAGTTWTDGDVVLVTKDKDGKETESPVSVPLPMGKSTDLSGDTTWLRVKGLKNEPKDTDIMPFSLYTRRSPNINLKIAVGKSSGSSSIMDWLKK